MRHNKHLPLTLPLVLIVLMITTTLQTNRQSVQALQSDDNLPVWTVLVYMASDNNLEYSFGVNWFFKGHKNKLTLDYSYLDYNQFDVENNTEHMVQGSVSTMLSVISPHRY